MEVVPGLHWVEHIWDAKVYVLIEGGRIVVIDAATPGRAKAVWHYLEALGQPPEAVDEIWITHADIDHMGSVAALKARADARLVVHQADVPLLERLADRELGPVAGGRALQRLFNWAFGSVFRYQAAEVDQTVEDGDTLGSWQVVHVPGHTPGSVCFYHPGRGIAIVGDALNHKRGRLGAPPKLFTVDMGQALASIQKIAALEFEICCFGHGPPLLKSASQRIRAWAHSLPS